MSRRGYDPARSAALREFGSARDRQAVQPRIASRDLGRRGIITPFARLARTHALSVAGDALFTIGLTGTVFLGASTDPNAARWSVALYLLLTFAPFVVAAPFIGPALDRAAGGRRWMIFGAALARAFVCLLLIRDYNAIWFYFEAFAMLVLSKAHLISRGALVPSTVKSDAELVEANSKLTALGAISAVVAGVCGLILLGIGRRVSGPESAAAWPTAMALVAFVAAAVEARALPSTRVAPEHVQPEEQRELHGTGIVLAASAISLVQAVAGFLTLLIAFWVKGDESHPLAWLAVIVAFAQVGYFLGSVIAPVLRRRIPEERMIQAALGLCVVAGLVTAVIARRDVDILRWTVDGGLIAASMLAFSVGLATSFSKQAFDALVQRDAPEANRGRAFARFETRFQLWWVVGALIPVVVPIPAALGFLLVALVAGFAVISYLIGLRELTQVVAGHRVPRPKKRGLAKLTGRGDPPAPPPTEVIPPPLADAGEAAFETTVAERPAQHRASAVAWTAPDGLFEDTVVDAPTGSSPPPPPGGSGGGAGGHPPPGPSRGGNDRVDGASLPDASGDEVHLVELPGGGVALTGPDAGHGVARPPDTPPAGSQDPAPGHQPGGPAPAPAFVAEPVAPVAPVHVVGPSAPARLPEPLPGWEHTEPRWGDPDEAG